MPLTLTVVTAERTVLERDDVTRLIVPTTEGQITVLPSHAPLMASLAIGEMIAVTAQGEQPVALHGGFLQVASNRVSVLADAAEQADDIDEGRADAARERAEQRLAGPRTTPEAGEFDLLRSQASLQRSLMRLRVKRRRRGSGVPAAR